MDDDDKKYFKEQQAILDAEEKKVIADEKKANDARLIHQGRVDQFQRWVASRSNRNVGAEASIKPPVGECRRHTDWVYNLVVANPGKLKRDQIIKYLKTRLKINSKDPDQSVGDALSKVVRDLELRVDNDGFYWPNESRIRRTKEAHQSMFSADQSASR
jgi:hypothetical protein